MWQPLINANQLNHGSRLRKVIHDGDFVHESTYEVSRIGNFYFMATQITQNGQAIDFEMQPVTPYNIDGISHYLFEIWSE